MEVSGGWPCPHSALEMVPTPCQKQTRRPLCKHHPQRKGRTVGVLGSSPSSRFIFLNKIITPQTPPYLWKSPPQALKKAV